MPSGLFPLKSLVRSISNRRGVCQFLLLPQFLKIPVCNANIADPDQTPRSVASDLGLQCLLMSLLLDGWRKWMLLKDCGAPLTNLGIYCSDVPQRHIFSRLGFNIQ